MRERLKNIIKVSKFTISALMIAAVVGCSGSSSVNDYDDIMVEKLEPVELNFCVPYYNGDFSEDEDAVKEIMKEIEAKLSNTIKVKPKINWIKYDNYDEQIKTLVNSGKGIDAFLGMNSDFYLEQNLVKDITEILPKYAPKYYKELMSSKIGEEYIKNLSKEGKLYGIPYNTFNCPRHCVVARKDLVAKYAKGGLETLEDYGQFLKLVKENEKELIPGIVFAQSFFDAYMSGNGQFMRSYGIVYSTMENKKESVNSIENAEQFAQAYNLLKDWKANGYVDKQPTSKYDPYYITNNLIASRLINLEEVHGLVLDKVSNGYEYGIYPLYMDKAYLINEYPFGIAVASSSANAERVAMFMEWLHESQENYDLFMYGIKDKNYVLDGENLSYPDSVKVPYQWTAYIANWLRDYRYERTCFLDTKNYREVLKQASLTNTKTYGEVFGKEDKPEDEEKIKKINREFEEIKPLYDKCYENINFFMQEVDKGYFTSTLEELKQKQKDAGIDKVIENFKASVLD